MQDYLIFEAVKSKRILPLAMVTSGLDQQQNSSEISYAIFRLKQLDIIENIAFGRDLNKPCLPISKETVFVVCQHQVHISRHFGKRCLRTKIRVHAGEHLKCESPPEHNKCLK